ncbi:MAG: sugar transferase [Nitriliruptoraceae bacterium]
MPVEERRRAQLQAAFTESWGEEAADTLMELVTPAGHLMATRAGFQGVLSALDAMDQRWSEQLGAMAADRDEPLASIDAQLAERLAAMDDSWSERFAGLDQLGRQRAGTLEQRLNAAFERGIKEAITAQTRALVVSVLVAVVAIGMPAVRVAAPDRPRPLLVEYLERYSPTQARRHEVRPGITDWAQINGRNNMSWHDKLALDVWYVDHRSLWLDVRILLRTLWVMVTRQGVSLDGAATTVPFQGSDGDATGGRTDPDERIDRDRRAGPDDVSPE